MCIRDSDGIVVTQSTSPYFAREAFWSISKTMEEEFTHVLPYKIYLPTLGVWGFNMASRLPLKPELSEHSYINQKLFESFKIFDEDTEQLQVAANSLQNQVLVQYYDRGWEQWH